MQAIHTPSHEAMGTVMPMLGPPYAIMRLSASPSGYDPFTPRLSHRFRRQRTRGRRPA